MSNLTVALRPITPPQSTAVTEDITQSSQGSGNSQTTAQGSTNAVTGTGGGGNLLSSSTAQYLMQLEQSISAPSSYASTLAGTSSAQATDTANMAIGAMDIMQEVANDPAMANQVAQQMSSKSMVAMPVSDLMAGGPMVQTAGGLGESASYAANVAGYNSLQPELQSLYQSDEAAGKSGAQTVADILQLKLSQSTSYWNAQDPGNMETNAKGAAQASLEILQQAMAQNATASNGSSI